MSLFLFLAGLIDKDDLLKVLEKGQSKGDKELLDSQVEMVTEAVTDPEKNGKIAWMDFFQAVGEGCLEEAEQPDLFQVVLFSLQIQEQILLLINPQTYLKL